MIQASVGSNWAPPFDYTPTDVHAVLKGGRLTAILPPMAWPEGLKRDEVLIKAWDGSWSIEQIQATVRAIWITVELPRDVLVALDALNTALPILRWPMALRSISLYAGEYLSLGVSMQCLSKSKTIWTGCNRIRQTSDPVMLERLYKPGCGR